MLRKVFASFFILFIIVPCTFIWASGDKPPTEKEFPKELIQKGKPLYNHYCAHCHGLSGDADGYNADNLDKEPAELSDFDFISKKTNSQIFRVISFGGKGVKKSHLMPVFGNTLSEREIWALVSYVRFLARDLTNPIVIPEKLNKIRPRVPRITSGEIQRFTEWYSKHGKEDATLELGEKLFRKKKSCFACHLVEDEGGIVGPDLTRAGFFYSPEWLFTWIRNPQFIKPNTKMPTIGLNEEEDRAVTAFLASLESESFPEEWEVYFDKDGDPQAGKKLFYDSDGNAYCAKCHKVGNEGGKVGPDLSFVGTTRTKEFLLESILNPKAVITAGYKAVLILTKKGKFLTGIKVNEDDASLHIINKEGDHLSILKSEIKKFKTQKISIMPGNFKDILSIQEVQNILAYLSTLKVPELSGVVAISNKEKP